jgi:hypothetical protein
VQVWLRRQDRSGPRCPDIPRVRFERGRDHGGPEPRSTEGQRPAYGVGGEGRSVNVVARAVDVHTGAHRSHGSTLPVWHDRRTWPLTVRSHGCPYGTIAGHSAPITRSHGFPCEPFHTEFRRKLQTLRLNPNPRLSCATRFMQGESSRPPIVENTNEMRKPEVLTYTEYTNMDRLQRTVGSNRGTGDTDCRWLQDRGLPGAHGRPAEQTQLLESNRPTQGEAPNRFRQCFVLFPPNRRPFFHDFASLL